MLITVVFGFVKYEFSGAQISSSTDKMWNFVTIFLQYVQNWIELEVKQSTGMESDDSCKIASVITRADTKSDLSDNQTIDWSNHQNLRKKNYPSCDGCLLNVEVLSDSCLNKRFHTFSLKLRGELLCSDFNRFT